MSLLLSIFQTINEKTSFIIDKPLLPVGESPFSIGFTVKMTKPTSDLLLFSWGGDSPEPAADGLGIVRVRHLNKIVVLFDKSSDQLRIGWADKNNIEDGTWKWSLSDLGIDFFDGNEHIFLIQKRDTSKIRAGGGTAGNHTHRDDFTLYIDGVKQNHTQAGTLSNSPPAFVRYLNEHEAKDGIAYFDSRASETNTINIFGSSYWGNGYDYNFSNDSYIKKILIWNDVFLRKGGPRFDWDVLIDNYSNADNSSAATHSWQQGGASSGGGVEIHGVALVDDDGGVDDGGGVDTSQPGVDGSDSGGGGSNNQPVTATGVPLSIIPKNFIL